MIKTNTDLILVFNPIVLFLLTGPGARSVLDDLGATAPPLSWLFLDFKHSETSQRVGKE